MLTSSREFTVGEIHDESEIPALSHYLRDCLEKVGLPEVQKYSSLESLRDLWLTGDAPLQSEMNRLAYLGYVLAVYGPRQRLEEVLQGLQSIVQEGLPTIAGSYIAKIDTLMKRK